MKLWRNLAFRRKMIFSSLMIVFVVVLGTALLLVSTSSRQAVESNRESLALLTEQALENFNMAMENAVQSLYSSCAASGAPAQLFKMRGMAEGSNEYKLATRDLTNILQFMVSYSMPFDRVAVLPDNSQSVILSNRQDEELSRQAGELFGIGGLEENSYGQVRKISLSDGSLWVVRDIYNPSPLRHVGKIAARVIKERLVRLSEDNLSRQYTLLFFDRNGQKLFAVGTQAGGELERQASLGILQGDSVSLGKENYVLSRHDRGEWIAVGLQPMKVVNVARSYLWRWALVALLGGMVLAYLCSVLVSRSLSAGILRLNESLNRVEEGDYDVVVPVEQQDEIGKLTEHFNKTTRDTKELLSRVVQEKSNKRRAEFMNLEYEYRYLQWQIKPHFIYNALETINALAKIDGNDEVCQMILLLSGYFRHNAETMRQRFVTVRQELRSLRQYVEIYRQIYGSTLDVQYLYNEEAGRAYLPTMIVQPLLENALVHGLDPQKEGHIEVWAEAEGNRLIIRIEDNGPGMSEETVRRILEEKHENPQNKEERTSLGVQNVVDRLHLLFGDEAGLEIHSAIGEGTKVRMIMPLRFEAPDESLGMK